jgi:ethanolamine ammonia-lyase large subunit
MEKKDYIFIALIFNEQSNSYRKAKSFKQLYENEKVTEFDKWLNNLENTLKSYEIVINEKIIE